MIARAADGTARLLARAPVSRAAARPALIQGPRLPTAPARPGPLSAHRRDPSCLASGALAALLSAPRPEARVFRRLAPQCRVSRDPAHPGGSRPSPRLEHRPAGPPGGSVADERRRPRLHCTRAREGQARSPHSSRDMIRLNQHNHRDHVPRNCYLLNCARWRRMLALIEQLEPRRRRRPGPGLCKSAICGSPRCSPLMRPTVAGL